MRQRRYRLTRAQPGSEDVALIGALDDRLWAPTTGDDWDLAWTVGMPPAAWFAHTAAQRLANHIPGNGHLTVKSGLDRTLRALQQRLIASQGASSPLARHARFAPQTFHLPGERAALLAAAAADPDQLWLQKPANGARGEGIRVLRDPADAPDTPGASDASDWLVQAYLADPHLIDGRKYVLRLYVLISRLEPLRVYGYQQGFAKLASRPYTLDDLDDPFVHQTNPDVNAGNTAAADPVVFIDLERYRAHLEAEGADAQALFDRIHAQITMAVMAARDSMRTAAQSVGADQRGCFEFLGLDFLVDQALTPWLLECNLNPSLATCAAPADGGDIEGRIKQRMVHDLVGLLGLNEPERPRADANATAAELQAEAAAELAAAGGFERLYPRPDAPRYWPCFAYPRRADALLATSAPASAPANSQPERLPPERLPPERLPTFRPWRVREHIDDDGLQLYDETRQQWFAPNPTATLIWLHACNGLTPPQIAAELAEPPQARIEREVWETLADWARDGLLTQRPAR